MAKLQKLGLARIAKAIGNRMIDVSYLCSDTESWFSWQSSAGSTLYTQLSAKRYSQGSDVNVYSKSTYASGETVMSYYGIGTVTAEGKMTCSGTTYTSTGNFENILKGKINKWAKFKPYRMPTERDRSGDITDEDRNAVNFGFDVSVYAHPDEALSAGWPYDRPTVDGSEWKRATDFYNYDPDAPAPLFTPQKTYTYSEDADARRDFYVGYNIGDVGNMDISLADLLTDHNGNPTALAGMYLGVIVDNNGVFLKATSSQTIAELVAAGTGGLSFPCPGSTSISVGSHNAFFVACKYSSSGWTNAGTAQGSYMPLPFRNPEDAEFVFARRTAYINVIAYIRASQTTMRASGIEIEISGANVPAAGATIEIPTLAIFAEADGSVSETIEVNKTVNVPSGSSHMTETVPCDITITYGDSVDFPGASSSLMSITHFETTGGINWII